MSAKDLFELFGPALVVLFLGRVSRRDEDQRRNTGERIGALERDRDYWRGWFDCMKHNRGADGK